MEEKYTIFASLLSTRGSLGLYNVDGALKPWYRVSVPYEILIRLQQIFGGVVSKNGTSGHVVIFKGKNLWDLLEKSVDAIKDEHRRQVVKALLTCSPNSIVGGLHTNDKIGIEIHKQERLRYLSIVMKRK